MIFSKSGFQSGAIAFARKHGIALVHVIRTQLTFVINYPVKDANQSALKELYERRAKHEFTNLGYTGGLLIVIDQDDRYRFEQFFLEL